MFPRLTTVRRPSGKVGEYVQLAESYRDGQGRTPQRVIVSLGRTTASGLGHPQPPATRRPRPKTPGSGTRGTPFPCFQSLTDIFGEHGLSQVRGRSVREERLAPIENFFVRRSNDQFWADRSGAAFTSR